MRALPAAAPALIGLIRSSCSPTRALRSCSARCARPRQSPVHAVQVPHHARALRRRRRAAAGPRADLARPDLRRTRLDELPQLVNVLAATCRSSARGRSCRATCRSRSASAPRSARHHRLGPGQRRPPALCRGQDRADLGTCATPAPFSICDHRRTLKMMLLGDELERLEPERERRPRTGARPRLLVDCTAPRAAHLKTPAPPASC